MCECVNALRFAHLHIQSPTKLHWSSGEAGSGQASPPALPVLSLRPRDKPPEGDGIGLRALRPKKERRGETPEMTERAIAVALNRRSSQGGYGCISRGLALSMALNVIPAQRGKRYMSRGLAVSMALGVNPNPNPSTTHNPE